MISTMKMSVLAAALACAAPIHAGVEWRNVDSGHYLAGRKASEVADMLAVSESTPGPIGINMATYTGYTVAGGIEAIQYYGGSVAGVCAIFSAPVSSSSCSLP